MIRPTFTLLALFALPFAAYALFVLVFTRQLRPRGHWPLRTLMTLATVGLILMLGNLFYLAEFVGAGPGSTYEPARFENGKVLPGRAR